MVLSGKKSKLKFQEIERISNKTEEVLKFLGYSKLIILWDFNDRFYKTIADAEITKDNEYIIRYSSRYWQILTSEEKSEIVTHEVCHITAGIESGVTCHNKTWRNHMIRCGYEPRLSLDISLPYYLRPFRTIAVGFCSCNGHPLTKRKLNLVSKGKMKCPACKERIKIW